MYLLGSNDGGTSFIVLNSIDWSGKSNNTSCSINWENSTTYGTDDNVIVAIAYSTTTYRPEPQNFNIKLYGNTVVDPTWKVRSIDIVGDSNVETNSTITLGTTINNGFEPAANSNVTWSSSDTNIATVDASTGVVTGVSTGSVTITATAQDGSSVTGTKEITVVGSTVHVSSVTLNKSTLTIMQNSEEQLTATVAPADATDKSVTWSSSDEDVAMVDDDGNVLGITAGTATITVTTTDGSYTDTCEVTVEAFVGEYELVTSETQLFEGAKIIIGSYKSGSSGYSVACGAWNSNNFYDPVSADFSDSGTSVTSQNATEFVIKKYGDYFVLSYIDSDTEYFINSDSTTQSQETNYSDKCAWSITSSDNVISMTGKTDPNLKIWYNKGNSRFKNYTSTTMNPTSLFIKTSEKTATDSQIVDTFINTELHMRDYTESLGYCKDSEHHYYSTAKTKYNSLTAAQKTIFASCSDAYARLSAWATANNETFDSNSNLVSQSTQYSLFVTESGTSTWIIVIVSLTGLTAIGGYFFYKKRKENI